MNRTSVLKSLQSTLRVLKAARIGDDVPKREPELERGTKVEVSEHGDLYKMLYNEFEKNEIAMPMTLEEFGKHIAQAHIAEIPDYYDRLELMEAGAKSEEE